MALRSYSGKLFFAIVLILFIVFVFLAKAGFSPKGKPPTNGAVSKIVTPTINYSSSVFQYDISKAEALLTQYIRNTIRPEFLPAKIEIKQGLSIDGRPEDVKYEFGSIFTTNNDSFSSNFHFKEMSNEPNDFVVYIQPGKKIEKITPVSANSLLSNYFINPYAVSDCKTKGQISYCENFRTVSEGKKGYGIVLSDPTLIVFNCFIPRESKDYNALKSCINL